MTLAAAEPGGPWTAADGHRSMAAALVVPVIGLTAMLLAPLNRFRRARLAVVAGWSAVAVLTMTAVTALTTSA